MRLSHRNSQSFIWKCAENPTLCKLHPYISSVCTVHYLKTFLTQIEVNNPTWPVSCSSPLQLFVADFLCSSCLFPISEVHRFRPPRPLLGPRSTSWASGSTLSCGTPSIPHVVSVLVEFVAAGFVFFFFLGFIFLFSCCCTKNRPE